MPVALNEARRAAGRAMMPFQRGGEARAGYASGPQNICAFKTPAGVLKLSLRADRLRLPCAWKEAKARTPLRTANHF